MEKRVGLYARTSMLDQNSDSQLLALGQYCERMGYKIVDKYIDNGFSGKTTQRPEFERLLADIRANRLDCVVVYKIDRFGRSLQHLLNLLEEFKNRKVDFISITQPVDTTTAAGKMFWQILGVFAEFERTLIVERTNAGLTRARKEGKTLGRPKGKGDSRPRRKSGYIKRWANGG
ncbi:MAG: recombinase family protein [Candidatus Omnitrophica bacterium]|nr:recombinase family protein [Candidatus Omnitrophota bacterium]